MGNRQSLFRAFIPPIWYWVVLVLLAAFVAWPRFDPSQDSGTRHVFTIIGVGLAAITYVSWLLVCSRIGRRARLWVVASILIALALPAALFRVEGVTGGMRLQLAYRWETSSKPIRTITPRQPEDRSVADSDIVPSPYDFPQFLGPDRSLALERIALVTDWETHPPEPLWRQPIGAGWSAFVVVAGYAATMEQREDEECVTCYKAETGELIWYHSIRVRHETFLGGVGPRATPTIHDGRVYALGATGILRCLDLKNGNELWRHDLVTEFGGRPETDHQGIAWGRSASPLVVDQLVIIPVGGPAGGSYVSLVAYDRVTGQQVWQGGNHQISYASPSLATLCGVPQILIVLEDRVSAHDPNTGQVLWQHDWPGSSTSKATASQAVAVPGDRVFLSKGYQQGASLVQVRRDENGSWATNTLWHKQTVMKTKLSNVTIYQGHVYGLDDTILECLELDTGRKIWKNGRFGYGQLLRVRDVLLVLSESGELALVRAAPDGYHELGRIAALSGKTWNNLCLYRDLLLVRNSEEAACYRLAIDEVTAYNDVGNSKSEARIPKEIQNPNVQNPNVQKRARRGSPDLRSARVSRPRRRR